MTLSIHEQETIRRMSAQGYSKREIAKKTGHSRNTVDRYVAMDDFSPEPPSVASRTGRTIAPFARTVDSWLEKDLSAPRKQRLTSLTVYENLLKEGYEGSYATVCRYVRSWREARAKSDAEGSLELVWPAGTCQVDYGVFDALIAGTLRHLHLLVVAWPHSNARYSLATESQRSECMVEGLQAIFEHVGAVPDTAVLDNATEAGRRLGAEVRESDLFARFRAHTGMASAYCNPYSGNEKGSVENAVGFIRRNALHGLPEFPSLEALNAHLLAFCDGLLERVHYRKGVPIGDLFREDLAASLPLPQTRFDAVRWESRKADADGRVPVDGTDYLAGPRLHDRTLLVGKRASEVEIRTTDGETVVTLPRKWVPDGETVYEPATLLPAVSAKPRSWPQSPLRDGMPEALVGAIDRMSLPDRRKALRAISDAAGPCGYDGAVEAAARLASQGRAIERGALEVLALRLAQGCGEAGARVDLSAYDRLAGEAA